MRFDHIYYRLKSGRHRTASVYPCHSFGVSKCITPFFIAHRDQWKNLIPRCILIKIASSCDSRLRKNGHYILLYSFPIDIKKLGLRMRHYASIWRVQTPA